ncbi:O-methyltransferase [Alkalibacillus haloalkaliphilus]|uniref:tRNA 5-hydroxyuridine methyltransferase n=1 Tax=Alkalibacillus haloalkaliphilus TaxID=94136 RepID=A0A511W5U3_9BACI|nr:O-methyltransferase [Alkalibacillus haloalkaliphilus]GEN46456.1 putative O-methyltransferase YrrM [Alkalibacillus haloalkaliphilus]
MNKTKQYVQSLYNDESNPLIASMEQYAIENNVPIMEKDGIEYLKQLIRIQQPKKIIEIGSAIGYSAIQMANSIPDVQVYTVERDEIRYEIAKQYIQEANLEGRIHIDLDDALNWIDHRFTTERFDLAFIDAAKGEYINYVEKITPLLPKGSLLVVDNVLFKGYVSKEKQDNKRFVKIGEKIASFNEWLLNHPQYQTTIIETGDGIAIALKTN